MKTTANIISHLFHPLLMATYGCLIVFFGLTDTIYYLFTPLKLKFILTLTILKTSVAILRKNVKNNKQSQYV